MNPAETLEALVRTGNPCVRMVTVEEEEALQAARDAAMRLGRDVVMWTATMGVHEGLLGGPGGAAPTPMANTENAAAGLWAMGRMGKGAVFITLDLTGHLGDPRTLRAWRDLVQGCAGIAGDGVGGGCVVMIDSDEGAPPLVDHLAVRVELPLPDEDEIERIIRTTVQRLHKEKPVKIQLTKHELAMVVRNLRGLSRRQAERVIVEVVSEDRSFSIYDLNTIMARKRQMLQAGGLLEYVKTPVDLGVIGGMERLKAWLTQREAVSTEEAAQFGIDPPRGVLMLGVQGAGKSLCAKAIATAWRRPLLRMDAGALYDKYIGESERRLREALKQAESMSPIILWIDEIEKAFASASSGGNDGGLSMRMFGMLLTWMQEHRSGVFLAATANDVSSLPPELLRKGRFDEIFFVDLPTDAARLQILEIHLKKRKHDPAGFDLGLLVAASAGYTGAEIEQAIVSAAYEAFGAKRALDTGMVERALKGSPPLSVTMAEQVEELREWAKGRCVPAD